MVKKIVKMCLFLSTEYTNVSDSQTPYDGIGRGKNQLVNF